MQRYRYMTIYVDSYVATTEEEREAQKKGQRDTFFNPPTVSYRKQNPERQKLRTGEYEPPPGWRIVSHQFFDDGISLLLEQEIVEQPYR